MSRHPLTVWRLEKQFSQSCAATHLGTSRWTINQIEMGKYLPSGKLARHISDATGVALHILNPEIYPAPENSPETVAAVSAVPGEVANG